MGVAQLVELLVVVQAVAGSSPVAHLRKVPAKRINEPSIRLVFSETGLQFGSNFMQSGSSLTKVARSNFATPLWKEAPK